MEEIIIKQYTLENYGLMDICKYHKIGKVKVKKILTDNGIELRKRGNQCKIKKNVKFKINIKNKELVCKKCGKIFSDVENKSGGPLKHIKECFPKVDIMTKYLRSKYKKENGMYWHFQFFDLIDKRKNKYLECPECNWRTTDLLNKSGSFTKHIEKEHNNINTFLENYPNYEKYFNNFKLKKQYNHSIENDYVVCEICNKKFKVISNSHLKNKHGISAAEYKIKFPYSKLVSNNINEIFKNNLAIANLNIKPTWTSKGENELNKFIQTIGFDTTILKNRKLLMGKEIDIIIEEKKIGFEYNGLYYHTEKMGKNSMYHLNKIIDCNNIGYDLIHIFEDEWIKKKNIVKKKIMHLLGVNTDIKIGARKTKIKKITSKEKSKFLKTNHLQGNDRSSIHYGAFYGDILVGVMCFNNKRNMTKNNQGQFELTRFATSCRVMGLGSKMLKTFIKEYNPLSIISFADRRWTVNHKENLYTKLGFKLVDIVKPNYYYYNSKVDKLKRFHKFGFGKNNLRLKYPHLDFKKTEYELMSELGYSKIWNCGLFKYEYIP